MEASGYWLEPSSDEFSQLQYHLGITLSSKGSFNNIEIWKIENPELFLKFEKASSSLLKVTSWTVVESLTPANSLHSICSFGFKFPPGGMLFSTGNQDLNLNLCLNKSDNKCTLIFSEVAIGKSYVVDSIPSTVGLPSGYDSFYVTPQPLDRNNDGEFSLSEYRAAANFDGRPASSYQHHFFIKNPLQSCPRYVVRFCFSPHPAGNAALSRSSLPQDSVTKEQLGKYEYFDFNAYRPVDMKDKITSVENIRQVVTINQAYETTTNTMNKKDSILAGKMEWLEKQLDTIDEKVLAINLNYAEVGESLKQSYEAAMSKLQLLTKEKLEVVLSLEIELRRQQEQIKWMEQFINQQRQVTDSMLSVCKSNEDKNILKLQFLQLWKCHSILHNNLGRIKSSEHHWQALNNVRADINAVTDMHVYCDNFNNTGIPRLEKKGSVGGVSALLGASSPMSTGKQSRFGTSSVHSKGTSKFSVASASKHYSDDESNDDDEEGNENLRESAATIRSFALDPTSGGRFKGVVQGSKDAPSSLQSFLESQYHRIHEIIESNANHSSSDSPMRSATKTCPLPDSICSIAGEQFRLRLPSALTPRHGDSSTRQYRAQGDPRELFEEALSSFVGISLSDPLPPPPPPIEIPLDEEKSVAPPPSESGGGGGGGGGGASVVSKSSRKEKIQLAPSSKLSRSGSVASQISVASSVASSAYPISVSRASVASTAVSKKPLHLPVSSQLASLGFSAPLAPPQGLTSRAQSSMNVTKHSARRKLDDVSISVASHIDDNDDDEEFSVADPEKFQLPVELLIKTAESFHQNSSLWNMSARKKQQLIARNVTGFEKGLISLRASSILDKQDAETVYFSLPFLSKPPEMKLIYSTASHKRSLSELYMKALQHRGACVLLVRSKEFVFGAYLSHSIHLTGGWSGGPACFLFSLTLDVKLSYHARNAPAEASGIPVAFLVERDQLSIGNGDLVLLSNLIEGYSEVEQCYGIGLAAGSMEAKAFLAGSPSFEIDELEVWAVL